MTNKKVEENTGQNETENEHPNKMQDVLIEFSCSGVGKIKKMVYPQNNRSTLKRTK